ADHADVDIACFARSIRIVEYRDARQSEVAPAARELEEPPAPRSRPRRQLHRGDDFVGAERRLQRAQEELAGRTLSLALATHGDDLGIASDSDARHLCCGVGVCD